MPNAFSGDQTIPSFPPERGDCDMRVSELLTARWEHIDLDRQL